MSIEIPEGVTSIGDSAFRYTGLTSINIPAGVTSIGYSAFFYCHFTSVKIPAGVTSIGDFAFFSCTSLTRITFGGTVEEWNAVSKGENWAYNVPATQVRCDDGVVSISNW